MNDGIAFTTKTGRYPNNGKNKGKKVTCYKCKKDVHYSNECDDEDIVKIANKKGSNFLEIKKKEWEYSDIEENEEEDEDSNPKDSSDNEKGTSVSSIPATSFCMFYPRQSGYSKMVDTVGKSVNSEKLLTNTCSASKRNLVLFCNAGMAFLIKKGDLKRYSSVWFHLEGITKTLSLRNVLK